VAASVRPRGCGLYFTPTVKREFEAIKARDKLDNHLDWAMVHLSVVLPAPDHHLSRDVIGGLLCRAPPDGALLAPTP
jgi:hypothetical protein